MDSLRASGALALAAIFTLSNGLAERLVLDFRMQMEWAYPRLKLESPLTCEDYGLICAPPCGS